VKQVLLCALKKKMGGNYGLEKLSNLLKVIYFIGQIQVCLTLKSFPIYHAFFLPGIPSSIFYNVDIILKRI
jgi:hypothetical protein